MGDSQSTAPRWINDSIRNVISFLFDQPAYWILGIMYQLFFNVASADLFSNETIIRFYGRVQIILGVFMMFQLAMTILRGIVNPGTFTDAKSGAGNFITRVATSLLLITLMMPISTPARNEYEKQINNNGILFGTLYSLQHRILSNNTIGRLVLGTNDSEATYMSGNDTELKKSSRIFTSTILKGFYLINLIPENQRQSSGNENPASIVANRYCPSYDYSAYERVDAEPSEIIAMVDESCDESLLGITSAGHYVIAYNPIISAIVAYVFAFILLSFTIDVAVRAVKLAVLRLIAPIPLISYMDPKGGKDSAFNAWVKLLTSTYLDLFIRLAVVYFVIFLIQDIMINGIYMNNTSGVIGILSFIIICIGLFVFAKQAPKFIKQAMGIKDEGGRLFSGFSSLFGAVGAVGATALGTIGSFNASRNASILADRERQNDNPNYNPNSLFNRGKHLASGVLGGVIGGVTGASAALNAKDHSGRAAFDAISKRNANVLSAGRNGGTFFGAVGSDVGQMFLGESAYDRMEADWKSQEQRIKDRELVLKAEQDINARRKAIMDRVSSKAVDDQRTSGTFRSRDGRYTVTGNYRDYHSVSDAAVKNGIGVYTATSGPFAGEQCFDFNGVRIRVADASNVDMGLLDANKEDFYRQAISDATFDGTVWRNREAYERESGRAIEARFGGDTGLKAMYGQDSDDHRERSNRLNRERADINNARQGYHSQRAQANAKRFRNGK